MNILTDKNKKLLFKKLQSKIKDLYTDFSKQNIDERRYFEYLLNNHVSKELFYTYCSSLRFAEIYEELLNELFPQNELSEISKDDFLDYFTNNNHFGNSFDFLAFDCFQENLDEKRKKSKNPLYASDFEDPKNQTFEEKELKEKDISFDSYAEYLHSLNF